MEKILQKLPIEIGKNLKNKFSKKELNILLIYLHKKHLKGESITSFYNKYGISRNTLRRNFKRLGLKIINHQNKLKVRNDLFSQISTKEDAYWLGFIYADGCISDLGVCSIDLKADDVNHLYKFKDYAEYKNKISIEKASFNSKRCRLSFSGKGKELNNLGVYPRKSLTLCFPNKNILKKKLQKHFIRGYFDGDGCYSIIKPKKRNHSSSHVCCILGTKRFLLKLKNICPITTNSFRKRNNIYILTYNNNNAKKFVHWIYEDAKIYLDRKYNKYLQYSPYVEEFT